MQVAPDHVCIRSSYLSSRSRRDPYFVSDDTQARNERLGLDGAQTFMKPVRSMRGSCMTHQTLSMDADSPVVLGDYECEIVDVQAKQQVLIQGR